MVGDQHVADQVRVVQQVGIPSRDTEVHDVAVAREALEQPERIATERADGRER